MWHLMDGNQSGLKLCHVRARKDVSFSLFLSLSHCVGFVRNTDATVGNKFPQRLLDYCFPFSLLGNIHLVTVINHYDSLTIFVC